MKKKNKNKARKSITAVGAVVAAGLTPGIATGTPATLPPSADVEITAADVISINGEVIDFDEMLAMQQINKLEHSDLHSTTMLSSVDLNMLKKLGIEVTCEPVYQTKKLYHK